MRRALTAASQCKHNDISVDDLIPILVFVIIKSGLTHWITTVHFLKHFIFTEFSDGSDKGVDSFLITTLEAAILFIQSIDLHEFRANGLKTHTATLRTATKHERRSANKEQFIEYLFERIRCEDEIEIVKLLKIDKNVEIATSKLNGCFDIDEYVVIKSIDSNDSACINDAIDDDDNNNNDADTDDDIDEGLPNDIDIIVEFPRYRVNLQNVHGIGAVHVAAMNNLPKILNVLLTLKADPEIRDDNNYTPLHYAAARGHQNTLLVLMHAGVDVTAVTNDRNTALHLSCLNGHMNCVKALLFYAEHMKMTIDLNAQNRAGETAIMLAAKWGFRDIVEVLLEYGVQTELTNRMGETAHDLAHNSHIVALLQNTFTIIDTTSGIRATWEDLSNSTSTNALNPPDMFRGCFTSSVTASIDDTAKEAFINKSPNDKIVAAIRNNDTKLAYHFLGIDLPEQQMPITDCHPLCDCSKCKRLSIQRSNRIGETKQMYDCNLIDECTADTVTVLQAAIQSENIELIEAIFKLNATIRPQAKSTQQTAIHYAVLTKSLTILDLVLMHADDDDIDIQDKIGDTALHVAVKSTEYALVECLMKYEPNVQLRNNDGKTPIDIARTMLQVNIGRLLDMANRE